MAKDSSYSSSQTPQSTKFASNAFRDYPLHRAARYYKDSSEMLQKQLEYGKKNINERFGKQRVTPLHVAADVNNIVAAGTLITHSAKITEPDIYGNTALHRNIRSPHYSDAMVQILYDADNTILRTPNLKGKTALHVAASKGNVAAARKLLNLHASIDCRDNEKNTPLLTILSRRNAPIELVQLFLENQANVNACNSENQTPLELATIYNPSIDIIKLLITFGANKSLQGKIGFPYQVALENRLGAAIVNLLTEGVIAPPIKTIPPTHSQETFIKRNRKTKEIITTFNGNNALHDAVLEENIVQVKNILHHIADSVYSHRPKKYNIDDRCSISYHQRLVFTNSSGDKVKIGNSESWTPLALACCLGHTNIVNCLLVSGADPRKPIRFYVARKGYQSLDITQLATIRGNHVCADLVNEYRQPHEQARQQTLLAETSPVTTTTTANAQQL